MNRAEHETLTGLLDALDNVYRPTSLDSQITAWRALDALVADVRTMLSQPPAEEEVRGGAVFTTEYELQCWSVDAGEWFGGCGWQTGDLEQALGMLDWQETYRRRVVRVDTVAHTVVLGERQAEEET